MRRNYFEHNGKMYYTGTVFIIKDMGKEAEAKFICYDTDHAKYVYRINSCTWHVHEKWFRENFVMVTDKVDLNVHMPVVKKFKETEIDGLFLGWIWYIFLMLVSVIFKDAIGLWIIISVVFFSWRSKKIKEEGTYIEW